MSSHSNHSSKRKRGADEQPVSASTSASTAQNTSATPIDDSPPSSPTHAPSAEPDTSLLPHTYQTLISAFPSVIALASLLWHRGSPATYEAIRHAVGPAFTFAHLRQMVTLAPHLLCFQPLLREREGDDPFASPLPSLTTLPLPQRYELLNTEIIMKSHKSAVKSHKNTFAASLSFRNDISRPKPPKPTKQAISSVFLRFKVAVVEYFAKPNSTMNIPECELPPIEEIEGAMLESTTSVPMYARLDDRLTVTLEANTDAATAPRIVSLKQPPGDFILDNGDDYDVQIIDLPNHAAAAASSSSVAVNPLPLLSTSSSAAAANVHDSIVTAMLESTASLFPNLLTHLQQQKFYTGQITYVHHTPARKAMTCEILPSNSATAASSAAASVDSKDIKDKPVFLSPSLYAALHSLSPPIKQLFSHQAQAVTALLRDKKPVVVVSTPTSSGKSLCYSIPISEALLADSQARVFALFPTKALAQDQLRSMRGLLQQLTAGGAASSSNLSVETYDGDTPCAVRSTVRSNARVILTNPDMLHHSILSQHHEFAHIFQKLKYVVLDETHVYRGGFGAHLCLVLRRLRRICSFYGSTPQFIFCSATISNTVPFVSTLIGFAERDIVLVEEDGSARGERHFLLWNPPLVPPRASPAELAQLAALAKLTAQAEAESNENGTGSLSAPPRFEFSAFLDLQAQTKRRSSFMESAILLANLVQRNYHSICFASCRKVVELVAEWTKMILNMTKSTAPLVPLVRPYRGGYSPEERRGIEREMFSGKLRGIVSTNALELGIDIGTLDASVHIGLPSTAASLAQQSGRAGRGTRPSLSILVAHDSPLDQFYITHPHQLFQRRPERCVVDFEAPHLLLLHLICAAFEVPLTPDTDRHLFGPRFDEVFDTLLNEKQWIARRPVDTAIASRYDFKPAYDLLPGVWEPTLRAMVAQQKYINPDRGPATFFAIRNMHQRVYTIIDDQGHVLDETEERRAMFDLFPGALYPNQGREYLVEEMNRSELKIRVKQVRGCKFYTHCIDHKHATILSRNLAFSKASMKASSTAMNNYEEEEKVPTSTSQALTAIHATLTSKTATNSTAATSAAAASSYSALSHWYIKPEQPLTWLDLCSYGRAKVDTSVYGYNRFSKLTNKVLDRVDLNLPLHEFETWAAWLDVPVSIQFAFEKWAQENPTTLPLNTTRPHANGKAEHKKAAHGATSLPAAATAASAASAASASSSSSSASAGPSPKKGGRSRKRIKREDGTHVTVDSDDRSFAETHPFIADTLHPSAAATTSTSPAPISFSLQPTTTDAEKDLVQAQVTHHFHAGLHGLNHCLISLLPMYLLCDGAADFQCECPSIFERSYETRAPRPHRLILWERLPSAGPAFVRETARTIHQLVAHAAQVIAACSCTNLQGCPCCIQSSRCTELNEVMDKRAALWLARTLEQWSRETPIPIRL